MTFIIDRTLNVETERHALCSLSYPKDYLREVQRNYADLIANSKGIVVP